MQPRLPHRRNRRATRCGEGVQRFRGKGRRRKIQCKFKGIRGGDEGVARPGKAGPESSAGKNRWTHTGISGAYAEIVESLKKRWGLVLLCQIEIPAVIPAWKRESSRHEWQFKWVPPGLRSGLTQNWTLQTYFPPRIHADETRITLKWHESIHLSQISNSIVPGLTGLEAAD